MNSGIPYEQKEAKKHECNKSRKVWMEIRYENAGKRNTRLDFVRGIAIIIVLFNHAIQANIVQAAQSPLAFKVILTFQMPLLFMISGYTLGFSINEEAVVFLKKKFCRLFVPYFVWMSIHYVIICSIPGDYRSFSLIDFFKEIWVSDFWFLRVLFVYYMIIFFVKLIVQKIHINSEIAYLIGCGIGIVPILLMKRIPILSGSSISVWSYLWLVIGFGLFLFEKIFKQKQLSMPRTIRIVILCFFGGVMVMGICFINLLHQKVVCIVFVFGISIFSIAIGKVIPKTILHWVENLGMNTLPVYAIHWCLLFSPLWRIGFYTRIFGGVKVSFLVTAICWILICELCISIFKKSKVCSFLLLGK